MAKPHAVIIGAGDGLSTALALNLEEDFFLTLAARKTGKLGSLANETGGRAMRLDVKDGNSVSALFASFSSVPRVVIRYPSARVRGPIADLRAAEVRGAVEVTAIWGIPYRQVCGQTYAEHEAYSWNAQYHPVHRSPYRRQRLSTLNTFCNG